MTTGLDINTQRGRAAAQMQHRATEIVFARSPGWAFAHTPDNDAAVVDGFILRDGVAVAFAEIKSRDSTYENMMGSFKGEWLLTHQKLLDIQRLSQMLKLPGYGFIYLVPSEMVLSVALTNANGAIVCDHRVERTTTQETVNGGSIQRVNSFINVKTARIYRA